MSKAQRGLFVVALAALSTIPVRARAEGPAPGAAGARIYDLKEGTLSYKLIHKLHEVVGVTHSLEGKARLLPDGTAQVQVRAKVASFDSGNSNRDEHMREVTGETVHPYVSVRGTISGLKVPLEGSTNATLHATVEMNGEKEAVDIPVALTSDAGGLHAKFTFPISLDALKIERPELLFVKVDDAVNIDGDLLLTAAQ